jgi:hypothetical protein
MQALNGAVNHIGFAGDSDNASENIKISAEAFSKKPDTVNQEGPLSAVFIVRLD